MSLLFSAQIVLSQEITVQNAEKADTATSKINKKRLNWSLVLLGSTYTASSFALYDTWYKDYPLTSFHTFDDLKEWRGVDKAGHIFSGYFQSHLAYKGWKWTGMTENQAILAGAATGFLAQSTIEVMDGFSEEWGFSFADFGANLIGIGSFMVQQKRWGEQRFLLKTSSTPINYQERYGHQAYQDRADELFGRGYLTKYLKDYNAQTVWISANIKSFFPNSHIPKWLNLAVGYGADNMFGGYHNQINGPIDLIDGPRRYSQFFLSLDTDLSKIETQSPFIRTLLDFLNILKAPFSTIEINTLGEVKFHLIRF